MRWTALGATVVVLVGVLVAADPAGASCVAPSLSVQPTSGPPGTTVTLHGQYFGTACNDTGGPGPALGDPAADINIGFSGGLLNVDVGTAHADDQYEFTVQVQVANDGDAPGWADGGHLGVAQEGPASFYALATDAGAGYTASADFLVTGSAATPVQAIPVFTG